MSFFRQIYQISFIPEEVGRVRREGGRQRGGAPHVKLNWFNTCNHHINSKSLTFSNFELKMYVCLIISKGYFSFTIIIDDISFLQFLLPPLHHHASPERAMFRCKSFIKPPLTSQSHANNTRKNYYLEE